MAALTEHRVVMVPAVLAELLSDHQLPQNTKKSLVALVLLPISDGYWQRAGELRARLRAKGLRALLADTLIAQCCIDANVHFITRDHDFKRFRSSQLKLVS